MIKPLTTTQSEFVRKLLVSYESKKHFDKYVLREDQKVRLLLIYQEQEYSTEDAKLLNRIGDWYKSRIEEWHNKKIV